MTSHPHGVQSNIKNICVSKMSKAELNFDEEFVCTKLAKDYLTKVTQFGAIGLIDSTEYEYNEFNNKIYYTEYPFQSIDSNVQSVTSSKSYKFLDLAEKINYNSDLFSQLEFLIRKIPVNDTKNVDLKLITQNLLRQHNVLINEERTLSCINIGDDTPLFHLGLFACKRNEDVVTICCTKKTVAVGSLFLQLCKDADLGDKVQLAITKNSFPLYTALPRWDAGCVGVVSATSDVDSAVDTFLSATTRYPWKLKKIYVQEPVIERFRQAMKWKQDLHSPGPVDGRLRDSCSAAYSLRGQIFLDEYVGNESFDSCPNIVLIDVFRTVKEVVSLTNAINPFALSLWCSDVAESNEIATEVRASVVWINGLGLFDGPPLATAPVYDMDLSPEDKSDLDKIISKQEARNVKAWLKLEPSQRMLEVHEAFAKWRETFCFKYFDGITFGCDATIALDRKLCIVTRKPVNAVFVHYNNFCQFYPRYLKYIADGGVVILFTSTLVDRTIIDLFSEVGAPIFISPLKESPQTKMYNTKVIWTSVGTIFAN